MSVGESFSQPGVVLQLLLMVEGTNMLPVIPMKPMVDTTNDVDLVKELRRGRHVYLLIQCQEVLGLDSGFKGCQRNYNANAVLQSKVTLPNSDFYFLDSAKVHEGDLTINGNVGPTPTTELALKLCQQQMKRTQGIKRAESLTRDNNCKPQYGNQRRQ